MIGTHHSILFLSPWQAPGSGLLPFVVVILFLLPSIRVLLSLGDESWGQQTLPPVMEDEGAICSLALTAGEQVRDNTWPATGFPVICVG